MGRKAYAQVYSLIRHDRKPEALLGALKTFSKLGYSGIEGIGANTAGKTIPEFKKHLDDLGLDICSVMLGFGDSNTENEWNYAAAVGARYICAGFKLLGETRDEVLRSCEEFNQLSRKIKSTAGIMNLIHNHAEEFNWVDGIEGGTRIYDLLLENTDPDCVGLELDTGWAALAGAKCEDYITKYSGRFPIIHVKECNRVATTPEELEHFPKRVIEMGPPKIIDGGLKFTKEQEDILYHSRNFNVELGNGLINWPAVVKAADAQGIPVYFVNEREFYHCYGADGDAVMCAKKDREFISAL